MDGKGDLGLRQTFFYLIITYGELYANIKNVKCNNSQLRYWVYTVGVEPRPQSGKATLTNAPPCSLNMVELILTVPFSSCVQIHI